MTENYHGFLHQMEADNGLAPPLVGLTTNGDYFNMYIGATNVVTDFFTVNSASSNLSGVFFLKVCVQK